ncbi:MAG: purine-binding chemotaxis protein CheW [Deltaproteobacteria bacterium]|nr:purine-binding chemotaxis protein CheW [Deltaproteobacteria bacterium]
MNPATDLEAWQRRLLDVLQGDLAAGGAPTDAPARPVVRREVLVFDLGGESFGIDIEAIAEILLPRPVTPLPRVPRFVLGVVSLRGTVLPVLDLCRRLGVTAADTARSSRILVLRDGDESVGFWVERVRGVVRFAAGELEPTEFSSAVDPRFLEGIGYDRRGALVAVLRAEALVDFRLEET